MKIHDALPWSRKLRQLLKNVFGARNPLPIHTHKHIDTQNKNTLKWYPNSIVPYKGTGNLFFIIMIVPYDDKVLESYFSLYDTIILLFSARW